MPNSIWNGAAIAESGCAEGDRHYSSGEAVKPRHIARSPTHAVWPWKGVASHDAIHVEGEKNKDDARYYPRPKPAATTTTRAMSHSGAAQRRFPDHAP
ncbi:MAG TPA: DUF427 domain-containing protein [Candidatus Dormibacteraeota bacterium]|nr:DUF427 domain-containing protein [Candidatus Dormibacteraeota bacterium]